MEKGQFSIEFIVVLGVLLAILAAVSIPLYRSSKGTTDEINNTLKARSAANELVQALNNVYSGSVGSKQVAEYWLPRNVESISGISLDNKFNVRITLDQGDNTVPVTVDTIIPGDWTSKIALDNINPEEGTHRTVFILRNDGTTGTGHWISVDDNTLEE